MVIIRSQNWGTFKGINLEEAKNNFINEVAPTDSNYFGIDEIIFSECYIVNPLQRKLERNLVQKIEREIELEIYEWRKVAEIESRGLARAQQDSMEG